MGTELAVVALAFADRRRLRWEYTVCLRREPDGEWVFLSSDGSGGVSPPSTHGPMDFLSGIGDFPRFDARARALYLLGPVVGTGRGDVVTVRLTFADGTSVSDCVSDAHVLLLVERPGPTPMLVELIDASAQTRWKMSIPQAPEEEAEGL